MGRRRIGVDIGSTAVRAAEVSMGGGGAALVRVAQVPVPPGGVENGEIRDPAVVAEALKELWKAGRFKSREVTLGVGNQRVVVREVSVPWLSDKEMRQSLPLQVQEYVPIPIEDAVLDFHVIDEFEQEGRRMVRLLLVAAQKAMVQGFVHAAELARLRPVALDLIPFAIVRAAASDAGVWGEEGSDEAVIDIGADVTSICVHQNGQARFVRILPAGGSDITGAISRSLGISETDAERLKRGQADPDEAQSLEEADRVALTRAQAFVDELRSSLDFYLSQTPGARIGRVLYTGGGSKLAGFGELLEDRMPGEVAEGRPFRRVRPAVDLDEDMRDEAEPLLAVAIGLALPGEAA
jgi:type IV pilus assembly protein PilM